VGLISKKPKKHLFKYIERRLEDNWKKWISNKHNSMCFLKDFFTTNKRIEVFWKKHTNRLCAHDRKKHRYGIAADLRMDRAAVSRRMARERFTAEKIRKNHT